MQISLNLRQPGDDDRDIEHDHQVADEYDGEHRSAVGGGCSHLGYPQSGHILFVTDFFQPIDRIAI